MRGICGDYNGDVVREMQGPSGEKVYREAAPFALSYVIASDRCDVQQLRLQNGVQSGKDEEVYACIMTYEK